CADWPEPDLLSRGVERRRFNDYAVGFCASSVSRESGFRLSDAVHIDVHARRVASSTWEHALSVDLGDNVEDRFGHAKFMVFYLLCGLAATFSQMAFGADSNIPNLGASGAIAGVLGAYILLFPRSRVNVLMGRGVIPMPALAVIGIWIVLQF